jgi:hypothetical protein
LFLERSMSPTKVSNSLNSAIKILAWKPSNMYKPGLGWFWIKVWCSLSLGQNWWLTLLVMKIQLSQ